jgi:hypothetical protein
MDTNEKKSETFPTSVLKKDPLPVLEVPSKKIVLVEEKSTEKPDAEPEAKPVEMEVDSMTEDVISPNNQT